MSLLAAYLKTVSCELLQRLIWKILFTVNKANTFKTNRGITNLKALNQKPAAQQLLFLNAFKTLDISDFKIIPLGIRGSLSIS